MTKLYIYTGMMTEVMKVEFPHPIHRCVPFEVADMFDDLFVDDPLYVEVSQDHAAAICTTLDDAKGDAGAVDAAKAAIMDALAPAMAEKDARCEAAREAFQAARPPITTMEFTEG